MSSKATRTAKSRSLDQTLSKTKSPDICRGFFYAFELVLELYLRRFLRTGIRFEVAFLAKAE